jgi:transposase-like protein
LWFFGIFLFSQSKNGVAAAELMRQLGVTYKTAHRMGHKIRALMHGGKDMLAGIVEADETYIGGKRRGKRGRGAIGKTPVVGIAERRGGVTAQVVTNVDAQTLIPIIRENVTPGAQVITDELPAYNHVAGFGFRHSSINHAAGRFVAGRVHTQTIDGFWSQLKRSIDGTHHSVSRRYLQSYVDEFAFRYSHRFADVSIFDTMASRVGEPLSEVTGKN